MGKFTLFTVAVAVIAALGHASPLLSLTGTSGVDTTVSAALNLLEMDTDTVLSGVGKDNDKLHSDILTLKIGLTGTEQALLTTVTSVNLDLDDILGDLKIQLNCLQIRLTALETLDATLTGTLKIQVDNAIAQLKCAIKALTGQIDCLTETIKVLKGTLIETTVKLTVELQTKVLITINDCLKVEVCGALVGVGDIVEHLKVTATAVITGIPTVVNGLENLLLDIKVKLSTTVDIELQETVHIVIANLKCIVAQLTAQLDIVDELKDDITVIKISLNADLQAILQITLNDCDSLKTTINDLLCKVQNILTQLENDVDGDLATLKTTIVNVKVEIDEILKNTAQDLDKILAQVVCDIGKIRRALDVCLESLL